MAKAFFTPALANIVKWRIEGTLTTGGKNDGDHEYFDVRLELVDSEYPVFYYNHDGPSIRRLADNFTKFIEKVMAVG